ncbi:LamG domain protein jellyroll fold domain protein [Streptomyces californicus]
MWDSAGASRTGVRAAARDRGDGPQEPGDVRGPQATGASAESGAPASRRRRSPPDPAESAPSGSGRRNQGQGDNGRARIDVEVGEDSLTGRSRTPEMLATGTPPRRRSRCSSTRL